MALEGKYVTVESDNFEASRSYVAGGRHSFGRYDYTVSIYDSIGDKEMNLMEQNLAYMNNRYLKRGIELTVSPYLYDEIKSVSDYNPLSSKFIYDEGKNGGVDRLGEGSPYGDNQEVTPVPSQGYTVVQFHYLPKAKYLLSYTILTVHDTSQR